MSADGDKTPSHEPIRHSARPPARRRKEPRRIIKGSVSTLRDELQRASRESLEYHTAWVVTSKIRRQVWRGLVDLDRDYSTVVLAAQFLWDHGHLQEARTLVRDWATWVQRAKLTDQGRIPEAVISMRDTRAACMRAALLHRTYDPVGAWTLVKAEYRRLKNHAGSIEALRKLIAVAPFDGLGLQYTEVLEIGVPVSRRVPESMRAPHHQILLTDAMTVIDQIPVGDRSYAARFALVDQTLYAILELGDPDAHGEIVASYFELDVRLRPQDRRGLATRHLMNMEVARYFGNHKAAEGYALRAATDLRAANLQRHLREVLSRYF